MNQNWVHFGMLLIGLMFIIAGIVSGIVAAEYVIFHEKSVQNAENVSEEIPKYGVAEYEELSEEHRQIVDGTIEGERYRFDDNDTEAIAWGTGRVVSQDGRYHVIPRETTINWKSAPGALALALGIAGILLIIEAIRRDHFPHYRPFAD
ncbi:hypothetical protein [Saliphagus sp. LR7]|uniref:hypothetical protein n=1 Tax=Saliphagus sp. LR7 TaxID=2282654 RepID=UPI000DF74DF9|nr:hypothetical protein [Saliphagus sp. LR7]